MRVCNKRVQRRWYQVYMWHFMAARTMFRQHLGTWPRCTPDARLQLIIERPRLPIYVPLCATLL